MLLYVVHAHIIEQPIALFNVCRRYKLGNYYRRILISIRLSEQSYETVVDSEMIPETRGMRFRSRWYKFFCARNTLYAVRKCRVL